MCKTPHGKVFIVSGNRCLFALEAFADKLQEEGIQCVEVNTLLVSLSDTDFSPRPSLPAVWKPLLGEEVGRRAAACAASSATATSI